MNIKVNELTLKENLTIENNEGKKVAALHKYVIGCKEEYCVAFDYSVALSKDQMASLSELIKKYEEYVETVGFIDAIIMMNNGIIMKTNKDRHKYKIKNGNMLCMFDMKPNEWHVVNGYDYLRNARFRKV